jgi:hypothetical protein
VGLDAIFISTGHFYMGVPNCEVLCVSESAYNKYIEYTMEERLLTFRENLFIILIRADHRTFFKTKQFAMLFEFTASCISWTI